MKRPEIIKRLHSHVTGKVAAFKGRCANHKCLHEGHHFAHITYFGVVAAQGHGLYALVALVLFVTSITLWVVDRSSSEETQP